jgi:hypothetical protein
MRFFEILNAVNESREIGDYIEDDADRISDSALINILHELQFNADHAEIPKIRVDALLELVKSQPGGEAFDLDALMDAKKNNETVQNIIGDIKDNDEGIKYVFIKPIESNAETPETGDEAEAIKTAPEKTVSSMAKRAARSA